LQLHEPTQQRFLELGHHRNRPARDFLFHMPRLDLSVTKICGTL
jgi:hypothetical protein